MAESSASRDRRRGDGGPDPLIVRQTPWDYLGRLSQAFGRAAPVAESRTRTRAATAPGLVEALSEREIEVLSLMAAGKSNQEIADELTVALNTVKKHVTHIFDKVGAVNRTEASARARDLGLLG